MFTAYSQAEQVRQKDGALSEKAAYVAKLEWRLLCQQKALEARQKPPLPCPKVPPANRALQRKPHLPGVRKNGQKCSSYCNEVLPMTDPPIKGPWRPDFHGQVACAGTDLATSRIPLVDPPKQPVDAVNRSHVEGRETKQPDRVAGEAAEVVAKYVGFAISSELHEDVGSNMHGSNAPAAMQSGGIGPGASRSSKPSARQETLHSCSPNNKVT